MTYLCVTLLKSAIKKVRIIIQLIIEQIVKTIMNSM